MSAMRPSRASFIPLDRISTPVVVTSALAFALLATGTAAVSAAERQEGQGTCILVPLDGQTTPSTGGPMAIADITVCYRALPADFWNTPTPVLKAQATTPAADAVSVPAEAGAAMSATGKPDPT